MGSQLCQQFSGDLHTIAYYSRVWKKTEKNYRAYEQEGLAIIVDACEYFRHFVLWLEMTIITDYAPSRWLMTYKQKSSRLVKFSLKLQEYSLEIVCKPSKQMFSRMIFHGVTIGESCVIGDTTA